jgi:hypothetical protein
MPLFKVNSHRSLNVDFVRAIDFTPADAIGQTSVDIQLRTGERIQLEGEAAQRAWDAFQQAQNSKTKAADV